MSYLIPAWLMALGALAACGVLLYERRFEHSVPRGLFFVFYFALEIMPEFSIEWARFLNRYFLLFLFLIDVMSFYIRKRGK